MKVKSSIVDSFGNNYYYNARKDLELPKTIINNKITTPKIATDSESYKNNLLVNDADLYSDYTGDYTGQINDNVYDIIIPFAGWGLLSQLSNAVIVRNIINIKSNRATHKWGKLSYDHHAGKVTSKMRNRLTEMEEYLRRINFRKTIWLAYQKTILFGGCMVHPKFEGDDNILTSPLNYKNIKKGSLRYFSVIEPIFVAPTTFQAINPLLNNFYKPEMWVVNGLQIHNDRVLKFISQETPDIIKPTFNFFSQSLITLILDHITTWNDIRVEIAKIIARYNVNVVKTDLSAILNGGDDNDVDSVKSRIKLFNAIRDNFGALILDKESEEWQQFSMQLNGLDKLSQQNLEYIAAMTQIPAKNLFSQSPQGFGNSGENEDNAFDLLIASEQTNVLSENINKMLEAVQYHLFGDYNEDLTFKFNKLNEPTAKQRAEIFMIYVQGLAQLTGQPVITPDEARGYLANNSDLDFNNLDLDLDITEFNMEISEEMGAMNQTLPNNNTNKSVSGISDKGIKSNNKTGY